MNDEFANGHLGNLVEPDTLTPHDFLKTQLRSLPAEPEQLLLLAVLKDGIETFQRLLNAKTTAGKRLFREAREWIWSDESDRVFSFIHVCEMLGLDPAYLRRGLREWAANCPLEANAPAWGGVGDATARGAAVGRGLRRDRSEDVHPGRSLMPDQRANASPAESRRSAGRKDSLVRFRRRRTGSESQYSKRA
jgi:hypothetical protein